MGCQDVGKLDFRIAFQLHFDESPKVTIRGVIDDPHPATAELVRVEFDRKASIHREGYSDLIGARVGHGDIAV